MQPFPVPNRITIENAKLRNIIKEKNQMNKKIISLVIGATMLASSVPAMATTEGIIQGDILLTSIEETVELNTYTGVVTSIEGSRVTVSIEEAEYAFILAEGVELGDITVGNAVEIKSASSLMTKDIKEAAEITKLTAVPIIASNNYNSYRGIVKSVDEGAVSVEIDGIEVGFVTSKDTLVVSADEEVTEVELKEGDSVVVVSTSLLLTKDIKFAEAIVAVDADAAQSIFMDKFDVVEDRLISADGNLVLNVEDVTEYAGKKLLVFYSMQTMSIPPQTAPDRVIVMADDSVSVSFNVGSSIININGNKVEVEKPYVVGTGVTLVPIRVISEAFGAKVDWNGETKTVKVACNDITIEIAIGSKTATVNGEEKELEETPELTENGFTMIPLRFISENLGAEVGYDDATQAITVFK